MSKLETVDSTPKRYIIKTYGCQMNEHDSEKLSAMLAQMNYLETDQIALADLIIMNTCCVRENAELKVYGNLGEMKRLKKHKPDLLLAICGCMMQQSQVVEKIRKSYSFVDLIFGTHNLHRFPELLSNARLMDGLLVEVWDHAEEIAEGLPVHRKYVSKAFVNTMFGCDNYCSYCIVPYTRGRERSREPEKIIEEIRQLAGKRTLEVTLLGQNVNAYGKTLPHPIDFAELLEQIQGINGIERIRFMTSHPADLSEKLINAMANLSKVCNHIHLPVQSGSNRVLEMMNRKYSRETYLNKIALLKESIPDIAITTDIIVGFPGEENADFHDTLQMVDEVQFDAAFTFLYSVRTGTPAADMSNQVPDEEKMNRFNRLVDSVNACAYLKNKQLMGKTLPVLVEGPSKNNPHRLSGRTEGHKLVHFDGHSDLIGSIVPVTIIDAKTFSLLGECRS